MQSSVSKDDMVRDFGLLKRVAEETVEVDAHGFALCPFHGPERTPSLHLFVAASGRARYHCFGCAAEGDVFNWLKETQGLSFLSAFKKLSALAGQRATPDVILPLLPSLPSPESQDGQALFLCDLEEARLAERRRICMRLLDASPELLELVNGDSALLVSIAAYIDLDGTAPFWNEA